jgi:hypothetical protein|tara:strand:+ start:713 stop:937 length:225 start_codon:yes stop_codon:yes gene_type:complete
MLQGKKSLRPTGEEIRQAKKFLQNKKVKPQVIKPNLFAMASKEINKDYDQTLQSILEILNAKANRSNTRRNKKS